MFSQKPVNVVSPQDAMTEIDDLELAGDPQTFHLIAKAYSKKQNWMRSTKAMEIADVGCVVQVSTQLGDKIAEAVTFVPGVRVHEDPSTGLRSLVKID